MSFGHAALLAASFCLAQGAFAQVTVSEPWVRATVPGQKTAAAYMEIKGTEDTILVSVASPAAKRAEIHETRMENGVMKMRAAPRLALPSGVIVELKPGGYHIMLEGVAKPFKSGDLVPISLTVEMPDKKRRLVEVVARVRDRAGPDAQHNMH